MVADRPVGAHVRGAQVAQVAQPRPGGALAQVGQRARQLDHLEREARRGGEAIRAHLERAVPQTVEQARPQVGPDARVLGQREDRADLHAHRARGTCCGQGLRCPGRAREPERQPDGGHLGEVRVVARAEHGLAQLVEHALAARRGVVPTGGRTLDDEAVGADGLVAREVPGQHVGGDDGEEHRAAQRRQVLTEHLARVELDAVGAGGSARHVDRQAHGAVRRELVEQVRDVPWDTGAHEHGVDPGKHRAEGGGRRGHLDLLQEVDPDEPRVALLGEPHLGVVAQDRQLLVAGVLAQREAGQRRVRRTGAALGAEVAVQHTLDHRLVGECGERPTDVTVRVAVLQPAGEHEVQRRPGDDAELAGEAHGPGQAPRGHRDPHPALDDHGQGGRHVVHAGGQGGVGGDGRCAGGHWLPLEWLRHRRLRQRR